MAGIPREVLKWLQSLDLTWQVKQPKWDITNGYLVAEIFSWYFPQEIKMFMFNNGKSLEAKELNWRILMNFMKKNKLDVPGEYVEGVIHCKEGAATLMIERIYEILTNRRVKTIPPEYEIDFTDRGYQVQLPIHARSTASRAVKNNIRHSECLADPDRILTQQKAVHLLTEHVEHRRMERIEDPVRFQRKPTLGEMALRRPPPASKQDTEASMVSARGEEGGGEGYDYGQAQGEGYGYGGGVSVGVNGGVSVGVGDTVSDYSVVVDEFEAEGGSVGGCGSESGCDESMYLNADLSAIGVKSGVFGYGAYNSGDEEQDDEQASLLQWGERTPEKQQGAVRRRLTYLIDQLEDMSNGAGVDKCYKYYNAEVPRLNRAKLREELKKYDRYKYSRLSWNEDAAWNYRHAPTRYHEIQVQQPTRQKFYNFGDCR